MSIETTVAILAMPGNLDKARPLLIVIANDVDRKFDVNLKCFASISSVSDAFLVFQILDFTSLEVLVLHERKE